MNHKDVQRMNIKLSTNTSTGFHKQWKGNHSCSIRLKFDGRIFFYKQSKL